MACPCKVVGFGLMGAAVLILAGKSLTKSTTATAAPRSLSAASRSSAASRTTESQAISRMRSQSRQVVGGSSTLSAPEHPIGHAHERMVSMVREREAPSLDAVMGRLRSRRTVLASSGYSTLAQRRRARRSPIVGS